MCCHSSAKVVPLVSQKKLCPSLQHSGKLCKIINKSTFELHHVVQLTRLSAKSRWEFDPCKDTADHCTVFVDVSKWYRWWTGTSLTTDSHTRGTRWARHHSKEVLLKQSLGDTQEEYMHRICAVVPYQVKPQFVQINKDRNSL